ncbi:MAG: single-stranded DNA-binding protein [Balneola sp.]|jgi:single-strand DNA-binding protein|nr:single-stranded DNA-binding protein [Balneola sp.]MBE79310.1 single-stranded DNA-binding protein [Balneola sp.]HBX66967.1 single-stranded DNA-binding protein [Balneolaceae bacterium]|tara:strand:- start:675 stop:1169 length:495 start_codon:yes stop_codon:yes gene_type:complete
MSSLNKAMLIGNLGQDPEVRYTQSNTAVATLSIATSERYKDSNGEYQEKTEWHRVVAWGRTAEICQQYLTKGSKVYIEGPIQTRQWEDKDGQKRYTTEIKALQLTMLDSRSSGGGNQQMGGGQPQQNRGNQNQGNQGNQGGNKPMSSNVELDSNFDDMDDDLPF